MVECKPRFSVDQIVTTTDVVREWRRTIEPKLAELPFILVMSGSEPRAAIMSYDRFADLWSMAQAAEELELQLEVMARLLHHAMSGERLLTLKEVVAELGITPEELEDTDDVDIEVD